MKIGIGCISYNRPAHIEYWRKQIEKLSPHDNYDVFTYIYEDKEKKGVAYGSNMCLNVLKECDHIFIFNDDCFPIAEGWIDYFINSGYNHSCYMTDAYQRSFTGEKHTSYQMSSGVFIYLTKAVLEKVGYFNPKYGRYGYEHAGYSHRIFEAGLTPSRFICLNDTHKYIYALDLNGIKGYEFLDHKRTITEEERRECTLANNPVYHEETTNHQIYYDFKP